MLAETVYDFYRTVFTEPHVLLSNFVSGGV